MTAYLVASAPQWLGLQGLCNNEHKIEEVTRCLSSQRVVAVRWLNWRHQLCNCWGGSNDNNDDNDGNDKDDNNDTETTTMIATTTVVGTVEINVGSNAAAALCQGLTTPGKLRSQRQRQCQRLVMTAIGTLQQQRQGQYCHAGRWTV